MKNHVEWPGSTQAFQQLIVHGVFSADSNLSFRQTYRQYWLTSANKLQENQDIALKRHTEATGPADRHTPVFCRTTDLKINPEQSLLQPQLTTPANMDSPNTFSKGMPCPANWCESIYMQFKT